MLSWVEYLWQVLSGIVSASHCCSTHCKCHCTVTTQQCSMCITMPQCSVHFLVPIYIHCVRTKKKSELCMLSFWDTVEYGISYEVRWQSIVFIVQWLCSCAKKIHYTLTLPEWAFVIFPTHRQATVRKKENVKWSISSQQNFPHKNKKGRWGCVFLT